MREKLNRIADAILDILFMMFIILSILIGLGLLIGILSFLWKAVTGEGLPWS